MDPKAIFVHIPKCGGTWVRKQLIDYPILMGGHAIPSNDHYLPKFGFIRNPWTWYVSWYNFSQYGSENFPTYKDISPLIALKESCTFGAFILQKCAPTIGYKNQLLKEYLKNLNNDGMEFILLQTTQHWIKSNKSYLEHLYDLYLFNCIMIGRLENIKADLEEMSTLIGLPIKINNTANINIGKKVDYRTYYTDETAQLVFDTHQRIITKHGYTFDK